MTTQLLATTLPVLIMIAIGFVAGKKKLFSEVGVLKNFVINYTLPFVLFGAYANAEYTATNLGVSATMLVICIAAMLIGILFTKIARTPFATAPYICTGFEAGMLGYPLFISLFGAEATSVFAIPDMGQVFFVFTIYKLMLARLLPEPPGLKQTIKDTVFSPIFIAIILGIIAGVTGIFKTQGVGDVVNAVVNFISAPTGAVILFTIGFEFSFNKQVIKSALASSGMRMLIMLPAALLYIFVVNSLSPGNTLLVYAGVMMFLLPPPYVLPVFANSKKETAFASTTTSLYTLLSIVFYIVFATVVLSA